MRDGEDERVLIVQELGSAPPQRRGRRRIRPVEPAQPGEVPVTRVTVTGVRLADPAEGSSWLKRTTADREAAAEEVRTATRIVNRALGALRAAAGDPLVQDIGASKALAVRIGHGSGQELAEGRWSEAGELPQSRRGRLDDVEPQSRVAAVLAGRDQVHPAETLLLRARLDAQQGREAEARHMLSAARAALDESPPAKSDALREQLAALERRLDESSL